jgi:uncharacterized NAD(P)/FAD-binding protein YdhS
VTNGSKTAPRRVTIVGGGATAVILAAHLVRAANAATPVAVRIVEREQVVGPGLPYRTTDPLHTLNNVAGRMSAFTDDPDHLVRWATTQGLDVDHETFLPRAVYGRYLVDVLESLELPAGSTLETLRGDVVDVVPRPSELEVLLADGPSLVADVVVLCLGTPPPGHLPRYERLGDRYLADPWDQRAADLLAEADQVLLVGTGLTMVDLAATAHRANPGGTVVAVSRSGQLPRAHLRKPLRALDGYAPQGRSLDELLTDVMATITAVTATGGDWREVVEAVRIRAHELWHGLDLTDQQEFARSLARTWDLHRHRMSPQMADLVLELIESGSLHIAHPADVDPTAFDLVVNCTGLGPVCRRGWNRLVDRLDEQGLIRPNALGLGLDLGPEGEAIDTAGRPVAGLYAVGAARKGIDWEATAVPDLRRQAGRLAAHLTPAPVDHDGPAAAGSVRGRERHGLASTP